MALRKKKTSKLVLFLLIILGGIAGYYYAGEFGVDTHYVASEPPINEKSSIVQFQDLTFDESILDEINFNSFIIFGPNPIQTGATGKINLFDN